MTSDHDLLWGRCSLLGRMLLPLVNQEAWRRARRHERLRTWGISIGEGERLIEIFAALAGHAVAVDASLSAAELDALPLGDLADAATVKRDFELLAGLPDAYPDDRDELAVKVFRLYTYRGGPYSLRLARVSTELRHTLLVLAERSPAPSPTCGDVFRWAAEAGLAQ